MSQFSKKGIELCIMRQNMDSQKHMTEVQQRKRSNLAVRNPKTIKNNVYAYAPIKGNQQAYMPPSIQKQNQYVYNIIKTAGGSSIGISPATTESSKSSLGVYQSYHRKKMRRKTVKRIHRASDTNEILPVAHQEATQELKSPSKIRPQSGGPSPDKNKLRVETPVEISEAPISQMDIQEKIFNDHKETQIILEKAKNYIQNTKKDIQQSIIESQACYDNYKDQVQQINDVLEEKVNQKMEEHYFIQEVENSEKVEKENFWKNQVKKENIKYKYAFGQRIPDDATWKVKPTKIEKEDEAFGSHKKPKQAPPRKFEVLYDYNGRQAGQRVFEERPKSQVVAPIIKRSASKKEPFEPLIMQQPPSPKPVVAQQEPEVKHESGIPDWIAKPFKDLFAPDMASEEDSTKLEEPSAEPILERKQRDVLVRSKSRGLKSGERPQKKPTHINVSNVNRKIRMNNVMNSVKSGVLMDPLILLDQKVRKTSNSKSKVKPLKQGVQVSAFNQQEVMQPQIIDQSKYHQNSNKKLPRKFLQNNDLSDMSFVHNGRRVTKRATSGCEIQSNSQIIIKST